MMLKRGCNYLSQQPGHDADARRIPRQSVLFLGISSFLYSFFKLGRSPMGGEDVLHELQNSVAKETRRAVRRAFHRRGWTTYTQIQ